MKINSGEIVAKVRATRKGKTLQVGTIAIGCKGADGRKWYDIRSAGSGLWTCSCPAYRFTSGTVGKKKPCKHLKKLRSDWRDGIVDENTIMYHPEVM